MKHDEFLKSVQQRAGMSDRSEAERTAVTVAEYADLLA